MIVKKQLPNTDLFLAVIAALYKTMSVGWSVGPSPTSFKVSYTIQRTQCIDQIAQNKIHRILTIDHNA